MYIRKLEDVIIDLLTRYEINGIRLCGASGIWIDRETKIGSIGIGISKWVTYHGLSVNIDTPSLYFDMIEPCGLKGCNMASLGSLLKMSIDMDEAKNYLVESLKRVMNKWEEEEQWQR